MFGFRNIHEKAQDEVTKVFNQFCRETHLLLPTTMEAFVEKATVIKDQVAAEVAHITGEIVRFEKEAADLMSLPGDQVTRELNRRQSSNRTSSASGCKYKLREVQYTEFRRSLDSLVCRLRVEEHRFIAEKGMTICQSYTTYNGYYTGRRVVLWANGRHFLISSIIVPEQKGLPESEVVKLIFPPQNTQFVTDSLGQFSTEELQALRSFDQRFIPPGQSV